MAVRCPSHWWVGDQEEEEGRSIRFRQLLGVRHPTGRWLLPGVHYHYRPTHHRVDPGVGLERPMRHRRLHLEASHPMCRRSAERRFPILRRLGRRACLPMRRRCQGRFRRLRYRPIVRLRHHYPIHFPPLVASVEKVVFSESYSTNAHDPYPNSPLADDHPRFSPFPYHF